MAYTGDDIPGPYAGALDDTDRKRVNDYKLNPTDVEQLQATLSELCRKVSGLYIDISYHQRKQFNEVKKMIEELNAKIDSKTKL